MMEQLITQASTYAADIDNVIWIVTILGGFWLIAAELALFYFVFRFSRKKNPKATYITGEKHSEKKWIHLPHNLIVICDIVIVVFAVMGWYKINKTYRVLMRQFQ